MKTACIYHSIDLDGWMSAAIVKHWFVINSKFIDGNRDESIGKELDFIGYNYGQPIPDLSEYEKVIMCDISFPKEEMEKLRTKLTWIDHHISALNQNGHLDYDGIQRTDFAACELTWQYFFPNQPMPEIVRLLGLYDSFRHKNTDEETKVLEFQYGARQCITDYETAYDYLVRSLDDKLYQSGQYFDNVLNQIYDSGKAIYKYLCTDAKQTYKNGFVIHFRNDIIRGNVTENGILKFICINKERFNPINFDINYHEDGYDGCACFHRRSDGKWAFSLYNDNGLVDCSMIAKQFGGGGHKGAAGFVADNNEFLNIIK